MKDKAIHDAMVSIENRVRHVYNQGFEEGRSCKLDSSDIEAAYQRGLEDAWECIEKICAEVIDGGLDSNTLKQIFGTAIIVNIFKTNSASEAIAKLKEYEKCQDCKLDDEIQVGDEVQSYDTRYIVVRVRDNGTFEGIGACGTDEGLDLSKYHKTGRHFPQIAEVLKQMQEGASE